jgi:hypothetical protein
MALALRRPLSRRGWLAGALAFLATGPGAQSAEQYSDPAVKAAFLYRFTAYVQWPEEALERPTFTFAVLGAPPVAEALEAVLAARTIHDLPAAVRVVNHVGEVGDAQLLFIGAAWGGDLARITAALAGRPVLVVCEHPRGLDEGGTVNFVRVQRRLRFEVSLSRAQRAGLRISSDLLAVAARVEGGPR